MRPGSAALTAALATGERSAAHTVRLGGQDVSTQVESWSLDRAYGTDLPDAMRAFSGSVSAQLDVTVTGTGGKSAPALYGPWAPRSTGDIARPGQSVVHGWGVTGTSLDAFRGTVRSRSAESGTDLVRLSALDGAERLRQPAALPRPDGGLKTGASDPYSGGAWCATPVWVVDHLLRTAGIHSVPPPRPTSIVYASLHGGAAPSIGYLDGMSGDWSRWTRTNAPFECALRAGDSAPSAARYVPQRKPVNRRSDGLWFEFWAHPGGTSQNVAQITMTWTGAGGPHYIMMVVDFTNGKLSVSSGTSPEPIGNQTVGWTWAPLTNAGAFHIGWWLTWSLTGVPTIVPVITGTNNVPSALTAAVLGVTPAQPADLTTVAFSARSMSTECFQVSTRRSRPTTFEDVTLSGTWTVGAALDLPQFPVRVIPSVSGSTWDVITDIARCTMATAEFDRDGFFKWRNHSRWASAPETPDLTVTSARELGSLVVTEEIDACRNAIRVPWDNWARISVGQRGPTELPQPVPIPADGEIARTFTIDTDEYDPRTPSVYVDALPNCVAIRASSNPGSAGVYGAVEPQVTRDEGTITLTLRNRSTATVYYHGVSLISLCHADGSGPIPSIATDADAESQLSYGVQSYEHKPGGWIQDQRSAWTLAGAIRSAGAHPIPLMQSVEILPDPRIDLGDVVRVVDGTGAQLDTLAWVVGNRVSASGGRITQTLTLRGTEANGVPTDTGLTPDPPTRPNAPPPT